MRLGGQVLNNYTNNNSFEFVQNFSYNAGTNDTLYIQLVDLNQKICDCAKGSFYLRYMPPMSSTLIISFYSLTQTTTITRIATQSADASIWSIPLLPTDE